MLLRKAKWKLFSPFRWWHSLQQWLSQFQGYLSPQAFVGHFSFSFGRAANAPRWGGRFKPKPQCGLKKSVQMPHPFSPLPFFGSWFMFRAAKIKHPVPRALLRNNTKTLATNATLLETLNISRTIVSPGKGQMTFPQSKSSKANWDCRTTGVCCL